MNPTEFQTLMQELAGDAVKYAAEEFNIELDFSKESLFLLDQLMTALADRQLEQKHSDEMLFTLCNILGAYVGEVFIRNIGGQWHQNEESEDAPYLCVNHAGKDFPFASVCYHKITQNPVISIQQYVAKAITNVTQ